MNKIGFRINCEIVYLVIIVDKSKLLRFVNLDNRDYIISVKCISAKR